MIGNTSAPPASSAPAVPPARGRRRHRARGRPGRERVRQLLEQQHGRKQHGREQHGLRQLGQQRCAPTPGFSACIMISDTGIADHSFNQAAWAAMTEAKSKLGITVKYLEQSGTVDFSTIGAEFVQDDCSMIIGVGFDTETTIDTLAKANPSIKFAVIDDTLTTPEPNAVSLVYETDQASFLGGYLAAGMSKSGTVGVYGNEAIAPVELYMSGYVYGVEYYNKVHGGDVKVIGWNPSSGSGQFVGSFTDVNQGKLITEAEIQQGADVIFAVAGPIDEGTVEAMQAAGGPAGRLLHALGRLGRLRDQPGRLRRASVDGAEEHPAVALPGDRRRPSPGLSRRATTSGRSPTTASDWPPTTSWRARCRPRCRRRSPSWRRPWPRERSRSSPTDPGGPAAQRRRPAHPPQAGTGRSPVDVSAASAEPPAPQPPRSRWNCDR